MNDLIKDNYISIVERGLINSETTIQDFIDKLDEEVKELKESFTNNESTEYEMADVILVVLNFAHHFGIDIEKAIKFKIEINKKRKHGKS